MMGQKSLLNLNLAPKAAKKVVTKKKEKRTKKKAATKKAMTVKQKFKSQEKFMKVGWSITTFLVNHAKSLLNSLEVFLTLFWWTKKAQLCTRAIQMVLTSRKQLMTLLVRERVTSVPYLKLQRCCQKNKYQIQKKRRIGQRQR